jgi:hypothetical protein
MSQRVGQAGTALTGLFDRIAGGPEIPARGKRISLWTLASIFAFLAAWRLAIFGLSWATGTMGVAFDWQPPEIGEMWLWRYSVRWDAGWYLGIAENGYEYVPGGISSVAFFPLFPLLIAMFDAVLPGSSVFAGLVVVHLSLAAAVVYVYQTIRLDFGETVAWRTVFFLLAFPTAFFFSAVYTESLFLLTLAGSLYHARRGQWTRAMLFGIAASATRIVGVLIPLPLALELWRQRGFSRRNPWPLVAILLTPLGMLAYFAYLQYEFGDYRAFFHTESTWNRDSFSPVILQGIQWMRGDATMLDYYPRTSGPLREIFLTFDTLVVTVFIAVGIYLWLKVRPSYGALVVAMALVPALSGSPQSMNRYVVVLFPAFLLLGRIEREAVRQIVALVFILGIGLTTWLFVQAYWAG